MINLSVGDLIVARGMDVGMIIEIAEVDSNDGVAWAKILWKNGRTSWEDIQCTGNDDIFEIVRNV